mmetsp:Transcript_9684/g.14590  ORF Transcript_9684/g.14590 Transcript_9684/m.14590 type:complete len:247 (+) Transcript_9684:73-813(+)
MFSSSTNSSFFSAPSLSNVLKWRDQLSSQEREHLKRVYSALALAIYCAVAGSFLHQSLQLGGFLSTICGIAGIFYLHSTPHNPTTEMTRVATLCFIAFCKGLSIGPLITYATNTEQSELVTAAFIGSAVIFTCFSAIALFAERRKFLYLYGALSSAMMLMLVMSLMNIFVQSQAIYDGKLYFGLVVFIGFILADTQLVIERAAAGSTDYVADALRLFIDFANIFVRLLIILLRNSSQKKDDRRRRR